MTDELYVELYEHALRLKMADQTEAEIQERLESLEKRMTEVDKMVEKLDMKNMFVDIYYYHSIQELWDELHAT